MRALVGLGGNLGDPAALCRAAIHDLAAHPQCQLLATSGLYRTEPWGDTDQPAFINAVVALETDLDPESLLTLLQALETQAGRNRDGRRWGPRSLDLDLLLYGDLQQDTATLTLPHPRMHERAFVLVPLIEIDPSCMIPGRGAAVDCLASLGDQGVEFSEPVAADAG